MTTIVDIINVGLQYLGTRTTVTTTEYANLSSNEAIQASLIVDRLRRQTLRMAPWNCGMTTANLVYITSLPGTPENTSPATELWQRGQPRPPWAYEYQYPVDCLRPCWIIPAASVGYAGSVPITTAPTGGVPLSYTPAVVYKVGVDQFYPVTAAAVAVGGSGYAVGDLITLASGAVGSPPIGAPAILRVATIGGAGAVATATVVSQILGADPAAGGSYFNTQSNPVAQGSTTGAGTGATFNLTFGALGDQRVILTNQEDATFVYVKDVTDPNVMDELFIDAWAAILGARLCLALTSDKTMAKMLANVAIDDANSRINLARNADANEGLTINDVTPDFLRVRGTSFIQPYSGPYGQTFDWGPLWSTM